MSTLLFSSADRDEAHLKLEEALGQTRDKNGAIVQGKPKHPLAECREDPSKEKPYQVWSAPLAVHEAPAAPAPSEEQLAAQANARAAELAANESLLDALADRLAARIGKVA